MIYIILSNLGMAAMMIILYVRYSHFRISSTNEIKKLRKKTDEQSEALRVADERFVTEVKVDLQKIQTLMSEIDELRKDKENEIKLRLSAEKQIELTLQKMQSLEKRMEDWKVVQDAVMRDSKESMIRVGNDLFKKLNDSYKQEVETNKNLIGRVSKTVTDFFDNFSANPAAKSTAQSKIETSRIAAPEVAKLDLQNVETNSKHLISDLVGTMKASGRLANKDYFLPTNFDEAKAKLLLCEVAFLSKEILHVIDFKSCHYLAEYSQLKTNNKADAEIILKQKFDRYFAYLGDQKYRASIDKVMATTKAKFGKTTIVIAVPSNQELHILKEIHYYEKAHRLGFEIMDMNGLNNVVL